MAKVNATLSIKVAWWVLLMGAAHLVLEQIGVARLSNAVLRVINTHGLRVTVH